MEMFFFFLLISFVSTGQRFDLIFSILNLSLFYFAELVVLVVVAVGPAWPPVFVLLLLLEWLHPVAGALLLLLSAGRLSCSSCCCCSGCCRV
jgi:hypothetical protein